MLSRNAWWIKISFCCGITSFTQALQMETNQLKIKLEETYLLLVELERLKSDIQHLSNQNADYFKIAVQKSHFLYRTYFNAIKLLVIDTYKILNPTQDFTLHKTLNFIISNHKNIDWYKTPKIGDLNTIKLQIESLVEDKLESIKILRDKNYAHLDKDREKYKYDFRLIDAYESIDKLQEIYRSLIFHFNGSGVVFSLWNKPPNEIISLSKYHKLRKSILELHFTDKWNDEIEKLWRIIRT